MRHQWHDMRWPPRSRKELIGSSLGFAYWWHWQMVTAQSRTRGSTQQPPAVTLRSLSWQTRSAFSSALTSLLRSQLEIQSQPGPIGGYPSFDAKSHLATSHPP